MMRWVGHAARMETIRNAYRILNLNGIDHFGDLIVSGAVILQFILK